MKRFFSWFNYAGRMLSCLVVVLAVAWLIIGAESIKVTFFAELIGYILAATLLQVVIEALPIKGSIASLAVMFIAHYALTIGACLLFDWVAFDVFGIILVTAIFISVFVLLTLYYNLKAKLDAKQINDKLNSETK